MSRAAVAVAHYVAFPSHGGGSEDWVAGKTEQCRQLLSHVSMLRPAAHDTLSRLLGDDPLVVGPRMRAADSAFRSSVDGLSAIYTDLITAETVPDKVDNIARFDAAVPAFLNALIDRSVVLEQYDATAHAHLRSTQTRLQQQLGFLLVGQIIGLAAASLLTYLVIRSQFLQVKVLKGLIPICASCKSIRDDAGYWEKVEAYIRARADVDFSHGICPECMKKLCPDLTE
jgi:hypothetical protein